MWGNCLQSYFKLTVNVGLNTEANIKDVLNPGATHDNLWLWIYQSLNILWIYVYGRPFKVGSMSSNICTLLALIVLAWSKACDENGTDGVSSECTSGQQTTVPQYDCKPVEDCLFTSRGWSRTWLHNMDNNCLRGQQYSHMCLNTGNTWLFTGCAWWSHVLYIWIRSLMTTFPDSWVFNNRQTFHR